MDIRPNIMDLKLRKPEEEVALLCERLRKERLYLEMTQADVAGMSYQKNLSIVIVIISCTHPYPIQSNLLCEHHNRNLIFFANSQI